MLNRKYYLLFIFVFFCGWLNASEFEKPQRIISLGSAVTENIYVLGTDSRLAANTVYCVRPPEASEKERIGSIVQVDVEKIFLLKPDLVIATALTKKEQISKMEQLGLKVHVFPEARNFDEFCGAFIELGEWVGAKARAEDIIENLKLEVNLISNEHRGKIKHSVFVQIGSRPLFAATKEHLLNDLVSFAGGVNIASEAGVGFYSREKVYSRNPDVIIIVEMGVPGEREKKVWESGRKLNAARNKRIYIVDSYKFCSPTPVSFLEALNELAGYLNF